jgi:CDGSH-type Zn-finger protein
VQFVVEAQKEVYLCMCKHTKNPPYCDGTHKGLY